MMRSGADFIEVQRAELVDFDTPASQTQMKGGVDVLAAGGDSHVIQAPIGSKKESPARFEYFIPAGDVLTEPAEIKLHPDLVNLADEYGLVAHDVPGPPHERHCRLAIAMPCVRGEIVGVDKHDAQHSDRTQQHNCGIRQ